MLAYRLLGNSIELSELDDPKPGPTGILIRVHAASLNRRDVLIQNGTYPLPARPGVIPLSDGAGEVVAVGPEVTRFAVGDRVTGSYWPRWRDGRLAPDLIDQLGCTVDGMATEYAVLDEQWAVRVPDHLSWAEAASLSCAGVTAWCSVTSSPAIKPGSTVLTLGTGDVSLYALRFAKLLGCKVIVTTSQDTKAERLKALGADHVINYRTTPEWGDAVESLTGGVDLVVETMGPETIAQSITASARHGEIVLLIWRAAGHHNLVIPGDVYGPKLTTIRRLFVGSRTDLEAMTLAMSTHAVRPVIDQTFGFDQLPEAYQRFHSPQRFGKVVITNA
jgi:NADPH:quinone reductase-like Zn-dependent oxidoreductase